MILKPMLKCWQDRRTNGQP